MIILFNKFNGMCPYYMSELASTVNSLPGIQVTHAFHHSGQGPTLLFDLDEMESSGLFFLGRSIDRRYFKWGKFWEIKVSITDHSPQKKFPIVYELITEADDYISSIKELTIHINELYQHEKFMEIYSYDKDKFKWIDTLVEGRNDKINEILL